MRSRTPALISRAARVFAGARLVAASLIAGALVHFSGCSLSTKGTGELTGDPCEKDIDCLRDACSTVYCSPAKRCVTSAVFGAVPDDANECTTDHCDGITALHDPIADGTLCSEGLGTGACQAGQCNISCTALNAMTVCNDNQPCTIDACDSDVGKCSRTKLDDVDSPGVLALPGDCQVHRCVGGVNTRIVDDTDVPTGLACFDQSCDDGFLIKEPSEIDTPCGDGLVCDGSGACIGCTSAGQCPSTECAPAECGSGGICGTNPVLAGTPVLLQLPDDCVTVVCDGMGAEMPTAEDSETPPTDSVECTDDVCSGGTAVYQPLTGDTCTVGGNFCDDGKCVECLSAATCPDVNDADCLVPACSREGACGTAPREVGQICTVNSGNVCNATGTCVACNMASTCPDPGECKVKGCTGEACVPTNAMDGTLCTNGTCMGGVCKLSNGVACVGGAQCLSGNCPLDDLVCCNMPCAGDCKSCGGGMCVNAPNGMDPEDDCSAPPNCNGNGMCG